MTVCIVRVDVGTFYLSRFIHLHPLAQYGSVGHKLSTPREWWRKEQEIKKTQARRGRLRSRGKKIYFFPQRRALFAVKTALRKRELLCLSVGAAPSVYIGKEWFEGGPQGEGGEIR